MFISCFYSLYLMCGRKVFFYIQNSFLNRAKTSSLKVNYLYFIINYCEHDNSFQMLANNYIEYQTLCFINPFQLTY